MIFGCSYQMEEEKEFTREKKNETYLIDRKKEEQ
jgi:hypothetical protein